VSPVAGCLLCLGAHHTSPQGWTVVGRVQMMPVVPRSVTVVSGSALTLVAHRTSPPKWTKVGHVLVAGCARSVSVAEWKVQTFLCCTTVCCSKDNQLLSRVSLMLRMHVCATLLPDLLFCVTCHQSSKEQACVHMCCSTSSCLCLPAAVPLLQLALASSCCSHACNITTATRPSQEQYKDTLIAC
jgi:hypothetical protein